jgi:transcription elongation GreA/GreB family factor
MMRRFAILSNYYDPSRILYSTHVRTAGSLAILFQKQSNERSFMTKELVILDEDKAFARRRIADLEAEIRGLGPEFYEVFNQSSETWHDNAPFDALRDRQSLLDAELQKLRQVLRDSLPSVPPLKKGKVSIGNRVELENEKCYFIAGDWTPYAGQVRDGASVVSAQAPIAQALLGKKIGDATLVGRHTLKITAIL